MCKSHQKGAKILRNGANFVRLEGDKKEALTAAFALTINALGCGVREIRTPDTLLAYTRFPVPHSVFYYVRNQIVSAHCEIYVRHLQKSRVIFSGFSAQISSLLRGYPICS